MSLYSSAVFVLQMLHNFQALISFSLALFFILLCYAEYNKEMFGFQHTAFTRLFAKQYFYSTV